MALMRERYTGTVFDVADEAVDKRIAQGYVLVGGSAPEPEPHTDAQETEPEPEEPRPTEDSTTSEIRAYAALHGIALPSRATKAKMLEAVEGAV